MRKGAEVLICSGEGLRSHGQLFFNFVALDTLSPSLLTTELRNRVAKGQKTDTKVQHQEIDTAEIEEEEWIEYMKRSTATAIERMKAAKNPKISNQTPDLQTSGNPQKEMGRRSQ